MKSLLLLVILLVPQLAAAKVYMCRDPATGNTTFTDKGCETSANGEELKVPATNVDSGSRTAEPASRGAWVSDRDTRKTGREHNAMLAQEDALKQGAGLNKDGAGEEGS